MADALFNTSIVHRSSTALFVPLLFSARASLIIVRMSSASMLSKLKAVAEYISAASAAVGSDAADGIRQVQTAELKRAFANLSPSIEDKVGVLKALASDGDVALAFTEEQRKSLAAAVVEPSQVVATSGEGSSKAAVQTNLHLHCYLCASDWDAIQGGGPLDEKLNVIVKRCLRIGLTNPSEMTSVSAVALVGIATNTTFTPDQSLALLHSFKTAIKARRPGKAQTLKTFPVAVGDFVAQFPDAYDTGCGPIDSRVSASDIDARRMCIPARKTHKTLQSSAPALPALGNAGALAQQQCMAAFASMLLQQQQQHQHKNRSSLITFLDDHSHSPIRAALPPASPTPLALQDGVVGNRSTDKDDGVENKGDGMSAASNIASPVVTRPGDSPSPGSASSLDDMVKEMQSAMGQKAAASKAAAACGADGPQPEGHPAPQGAAKRAAKGKAKGKGKAKAASKAAAKAKAAGKPSSPSAAHGKSSQGKTKRPSMGVEWTRFQVQARTGRPGIGQSKAFPFQGNNPDQAKKKARTWLAEKCKELGIDF